MQVADEPRVIWSHGGTALLGYGGWSHDPGAGPGRYERAGAALRSSGQDLAFASFTFDPEETGSVVVIPEKVFSVGEIPGPHHDSSRVEVISDGTWEWRAGMGRVQAALASGLVEKVVLARQVHAEVDPAPNPVLMAARLGIADKSSYTFLVEGLVGSSPELLVSLRNGRLTSLALAGSAADQHGLGSEKMRREHSLAVESVRAGLRRHVRSLDEDSGGTLVFGAIHHLGTRLGGMAEAGTSVTRVLADLHPTAGVAGVPTPAALDLIREIEPKSRGRYAGPVGWFRPTGEGEFAIALRCGLIEGDQATLYAGGGIIEGSDLDDELAETEIKLHPMLSALGG